MKKLFSTLFCIIGTNSAFAMKKLFLILFCTTVCLNTFTSSRRHLPKSSRSHRETMRHFREKACEAAKKASNTKDPVKKEAYLVRQLIYIERANKEQSKYTPKATALNRRLTLPKLV